MSRGFTTEWLVRHATKSRTPQAPHPEQREREVPLAQRGGAKAPSAGCPTVRFILCRVSLLDVDAKYGSVKDLLDGLRYAGLIRGDKEGEVQIEVRQKKVDCFAKEMTLIDIDYE